MSLTNLTMDLAAELKRAGQSVAVAESSAGGLISASLLAVPGASSYYKGGTVIYTLASRKTFLGVNRDDVQGIEPMTEPMAAHFADAVRVKLESDWAIAELGIAGPTGSAYGFAPGTCVIAVTGPVSMATTVQTGSADREANMWQFTEAALKLLARGLEEAAVDH